MILPFITLILCLKGHKSQKSLFVLEIDLKLYLTAQWPRALGSGHVHIKLKLKAQTLFGWGRAMTQRFLVRNCAIHSGFTGILLKKLKLE